MFHCNPWKWYRYKWSCAPIIMVLAAAKTWFNMWGSLYLIKFCHITCFSALRFWSKFHLNIPSNQACVKYKLCFLWIMKPIICLLLIWSFLYLHKNSLWIYSLTWSRLSCVFESTRPHRLSSPSLCFGLLKNTLIVLFSLIFLFSYVGKVRVRGEQENGGEEAEACAKEREVLHGLLWFSRAVQDPVWWHLCPSPSSPSHPSLPTILPPRSSHQALSHQVSLHLSCINISVLPFLSLNQ